MLGNTWEHVYPRFVPGYTKCSPACRTSPASGTFYTAMRGNILCTQVQNAGTRVPGKRNVHNNMGTNHGVTCVYASQRGRGGEGNRAHPLLELEEESPLLLLLLLSLSSPSFSSFFTTFFLSSGLAATTQ